MRDWISPITPRLLRRSAPRNDAVFFCGHCERSEAISLSRRAGVLLFLLVIAVALAGCGKKGAPQPPPDEPNTFPRSYPNV
jgi:predicted small lipoprotein YifL